MTLGIYLDATPGAADGTLKAPGDGEGITLRGIGSTAVFCLRCDDGERTDESLAIPAPQDCEVSADGITYDTEAVYASGDIRDLNVACHVRRVADTVDGTLATGIFTVPPIASVAVVGYMPVIAGTLTATPGDTQVTLSGPTATNVAKWQRRVGDGAWVDIPDSATGTMPEVVVTGLTNGVEYTFSVRALDGDDNASGTLQAQATPVSAFVDESDDFTGRSLDTDKWSTSVGGSGTVTFQADYDRVRLYTRSGSSYNADACLLRKKAALPSVFDYKFKLEDVSNYSYAGLFVLQAAALPGVDASTTVNPLRRLLVLSSAGSANALIAYHWDINGTQQLWDFPNDQWVTSGNTNLAWAGGVYYVRLTRSGSSWRLRLYNASDQLIEDTGAFSVQDNSDPYWLVIGDPYTNASNGTLMYVHEFQHLG